MELKFIDVVSRTFFSLGILNDEAWSESTLIIVGVLISGGYNGGHLKSVELYNPATNISCSLPQLPVARQYHTQDGGLACGGQLSKISCDKWNSYSGTWTQSHTLRQSRDNHVSWATEDGVYLMGGWDNSSRLTTELVKKDGSVEDGFSLKYDTR